MTWSAPTTLMAVYLVDGEDLILLPIVPGSLTISGTMDDLCRTASFQLAGQPDPRPQRSDDILIRYLDFDDSLMFDAFGGRLQRPDTESQPWQQDHVASDQLEKLRRTKRGGDLDLTGSTDGEAWQLIADYCGVGYDDADIGDAGYVLGAQEPVAWHDDGSTSGAQMVQELDRVFGFKTMTVGNNRVVRIPYDPTPTASTGVYRTLTKGTTADWQKHHRGGGSRDQVVNAWRVTGATIAVSDQCSATVWSDAYDSVTELGPGVRPADGTYQSDLIQSEDLAEEVVRRLMRINNRVPETGSGTIGNDPNVYPCTKLALQDTTYGIGANPRYATVTAYRWTYPTLDIDFICGPAGDEGTVTHGVDKVCNDTHGDIDIPGGGFDFPAFDVPPLDAGSVLDFTPPDLTWRDTASGAAFTVRAIPPGGSYDAPIAVSLVPTATCIIYYTDDGSTPTTSSTMFTTPIALSTDTVLKFFGRQDAEHISEIVTEAYVFTGGGGGFTCDVPLTADWTNDSGLLGDWTFLGDGDAEDVNSGSIHNTGISVTDGQSWEIRTTLLVGANKSAEFGIGFDGLSAQYDVLAYATPSSGTGIDVATLAETKNDPTDITGSPSDVVLTYDADAKTLTFRLDALGILLVAADPYPPTGTMYPYVRVYDEGGGGLATGGVQDMEVCIGGEGEVLSPADWTALVGTPTITGDDAIDFTDSGGDEDAYAAGHTFDGTERCRFTGHADMGTSSHVIVSWLLDDSEGAATGIFAGVQVIYSPTPSLYVYTWDGYQTDLGTDLSGLVAGFDFALDWNPDADYFAFTFVDSNDGTTLASWVGALGTWPGDKTVHLEHGTPDVSCDWHLSNLVVRVGT